VTAPNIPNIPKVPNIPEQRALAWYTRPRIVLPLVAAVIVASALLTPEATTGRGGDPRLTTYSSAPQGGMLFYEMTKRLGWNVEQRKAADLPADTTAIIAELAPVVPLRITDVHALLERVRHGGALLLMLSDGSHMLAESLHVSLGQGRTRVPARRSAPDVSDCAPDAPGLFNTRMLYTLWPGDQVALNTIVWSGPAPDSVTALVLTDRAPEDKRARAAAVGFPYGHGRIVIGADPDLLRNDAIRVCKYGLDITAVAMLDYLSVLNDSTQTYSRRVVFDEYHQGFGEQRGTMDAVASYLVGVGSGRLLFQLLAAGLVLLLAVAPRLIPPFDPERIERRSPLEHVDALGRAYAQVGATRSATARLVRGVRRRLAGGAIRPGIDATDDAFLDRALRDAPQMTDDIALIRKALRSQISRRDFALVGAALEQLELSLTRI
jgi:hypothetical protein